MDIMSLPRDHSPPRRSRPHRLPGKFKCDVNLRPHSGLTAGCNCVWQVSMTAAERAWRLELCLNALVAVENRFRLARTRPGYHRGRLDHVTELEQRGHRCRIWPPTTT